MRWVEAAEFGGETMTPRTNATSWTASRCNPGCNPLDLLGNSVLSSPRPFDSMLHWHSGPQCPSVQLCLRCQFPWGMERRQTW